MSEPVHQATNKEVRNWGLGAIAAGLISAATILTYFSGLWGAAVQAGLPKEGSHRLVTVEQFEGVVRAMDALDAGTARKEDVEAVKSQMNRVEGKLDRLIEIQLKQKGGK